MIDDGKNPDEFTRDVLNSCIAKNQITKGKTDAFKVNFYFIAFNIVWYVSFDLMDMLEVSEFEFVFGFINLY